MPRISSTGWPAAKPDVIVAELGDGILGEYGVQDILEDPAARELGGAWVLCANDPVGAAGGVRHLKETYGIQVDVVAGPATDNAVGIRFVEQRGGTARAQRASGCRRPGRPHSGEGRAEDRGEEGS